MIFRKLYALVIIVIFSSSAWALPLRFQEGIHYDVINEQATGRKDVVEYFSYNCPHCFSFDPMLESYLSQKPTEVQFKRVPVTFGRQTWKMSARAYVLAKALGKEDVLHSKIFHKVQSLNRPFQSENDIKDFFLANGIIKESFIKALKSFTATTLTKSHQSMIEKYAIASVPTVIVNGKYRVNISHDLDNNRFIQLVDFLTTMNAN